MKRVVLGGALAALLLVGCGGGAAPTSAPGGPTQAPGGATQAPIGGPTQAPAGTPATNPQPNTGDLEAMVRALTPPGSTELQFVESGGVTALYLSSTTPLDQLEAFFDQAIPAQGITIAGKSEQVGTLIYSLENPVGGVVVTPADQAGSAITISLGQSQ